MASTAWQRTLRSLGIPLPLCTRKTPSTTIEIKSISSWALETFFQSAISKVRPVTMPAYATTPPTTRYSTCLEPTKPRSSSLTSRCKITAVDYGTVPAEELTNYWVEGASEGANSALNTYLTCIDASDRDLEYFINELRNIGRPVVLVFFGDHQPSAATTLNDELYPQEDTAATLSVSISRHILSGLTMKSPAIPSSTSTTPSGQTRLQPLPLIRSAPRSPTIKRLCLQQGQMCPPSMSPATLVPTGCATTWNLKTAHTPRRSTSCSACNTSSSPAKLQ